MNEKLFASILPYKNYKNMSLCMLREACEEGKSELVISIAKFFDLHLTINYSEIYSIIVSALLKEQFELAEKIIRHFAITKYDIISHHPNILSSIYENGNLDVVKFLVSLFKIEKYNPLITPEHLRIIYKNEHRELMEWMINYFNYTKKDLYFIKRDSIRLKGSYYLAVREIFISEMKEQSIRYHLHRDCSICSRESVKHSAITWITPSGRVFTVHKYAECSQEYKSDFDFWRWHTHVVTWALVCLNIFNLPREMNEFILELFLN